MRESIKVGASFGALAIALAFGAPAFAQGKKVDAPKGPLVIKSQGSFFVGGEKQRSEALTGVASGGDLGPNQGGITTGQMYVQFQIPERGSGTPIVLIHGGALSGKAYETTPDGRMGWNEYLLRKGRSVYVVDQVARARSSFDGTIYNQVKLGLAPPDKLPGVLMVSHEIAWTWFRMGPKFGTPFADTQFPVEAVDEFYKQGVSDLSALVPNPNPNFANLAALANKAGGAVLVSHSQSFMFPERAALIDPKGVKGIISLETGYACGTPLTAEEVGKLSKIPILFVFSDHLGDAPDSLGKRWTESFENCKKIIAQLKAAGGDATMLHLPELGIRGNSHLMMYDKNNLQVADLLLKWIGEHVEAKKVAQKK
jgi:pimeloyl-ACP methyl ester carboxylesterase